MGRGKWINKKTAQHFTLVHRPQNDPLIHDEDAPSMVLNPTKPIPGSSRAKHLEDLASEFGSEAEHIRANEGEAASHGVYFDDSEYDYMQHMRDLNTGAGEVVFVEAQATGNKDKGKQKQSLEDALKDLELEKKSNIDIDDEFLPSKNLRRQTYEAQQNVPDAIAGFQPDMDPRLREALEALEDDEYVDDDDDIFKQLTRDGHELDDYEFDETYDNADDDGWESDDTAKPTKEYKDEVPNLVTATTEQPEEGPSQAWMEDFKQFKQAQKTGRTPIAPSQSEQQSMWTTTTNGGRRKKRKGALTNPSSYSMSSSALVRTEQMNLLDMRFDKLEERYNEDDEDDMASVNSAVSNMSSVQGPLRGDFDNILDDFLGNYTKPGKRTSKKMKAQTGLEQLEEIRQNLGPARIRGRG